MRIFKTVGYALTASAALAMLAGCSGGSSQVAPFVGGQTSTIQSIGHHQLTGDMFGLLPAYQHGLNLNAGVNQTPNWVTPEVRQLARNHGLLFVCDEGVNEVNIYPKNKPSTKVGTITNGVDLCDGVGVDRSGNVYVTNLGNGTVNAYAPPFTGGPATVYSPGGSPVGVAIGDDGSVYVSDYSNQRLTEYPPGSTTPSNVCNTPGGGLGIALDASNNLWLAMNLTASGSGVVYEYASGAGCTGTNVGISLGFVGGVTFDSSGNLLVEDQHVGIEVFPPGATMPSQTIKGFIAPFAMAFGVLQKRLYVDDPVANKTVELAYPAGTVVNTVPGGSSSWILGDGLDPEAPK